MNKIILADKDGKPIAVTPDGCLYVSDCGAPPLKTQKTKIFSQKFTTTGLAAGSSDMGIDGSATPVEFYIPADQDVDRYITRVSFLMGYGTSSDLYVFADAGAALTNGVKLSYTNALGEETTIMSPKANYSFMRASGIPVTNTNWETRGFAARGDYGFFVNIDISKMMPSYGIKLDRGTIERISVLIQDDCQAADLFNCQAFGFSRNE